MNRSIARALVTFQRSGARYQAVIKRVQAKCKHKSVLHNDGRYGTYVGRFDATRICLDCGYEEHGNGVGDGDYLFDVLRTNGFHCTVDSDAIYKARVPHAPIHTVKR